jgi:hypothetical protein
VCRSPGRSPTRRVTATRRTAVVHDRTAPGSARCAPTHQRSTGRLIFVDQLSGRPRLRDELLG